MKIACCALVICFLCSGEASAQDCSYAPPVRYQSMFRATETFRNGIGIEVVLNDTNVASLDLLPSEFKEAASMGVRASGWSCNEGSDYLIVISLASAPQVHEDLDAVRIRVQAGGRSGGTGVEQNFGGGIVAEKIVEMPRSDHTLAISIAQEMARGVAAKLRMALLRGALRTPVDPLENPGNNQPGY